MTYREPNFLTGIDVVEAIEGSTPESKAEYSLHSASVSYRDGALLVKVETDDRDKGKVCVTVQRDGDNRYIEIAVYNTEEARAAISGLVRYFGKIDDQTA